MTAVVPLADHTTPPAVASAEHVVAPDVDDTAQTARFTRWSAGRDGERIGESSLRIGGMVCAACAGIVENALAGVDGVLGASVSASGERATVRWDARRTKASTLLDAIRRAGYDAAPDTVVAGKLLRRDENRRALWRVFVAGFCAMQVMMLASPRYLAAPGEIEPDLVRLLQWGEWMLSVPVLLFAAAPFWKGALRSIRMRRIGMEVPVALGIAVTFVASTGAMFDPGGPFGRDVYFDSLTMFVSFLLAGRFLEMRVRHRAAQALENALGAMPETAIRLRSRDGSAERVPVEGLVPGDRLRVPAGEAFAADGVVVEGFGDVDESMLTGESRPVRKCVGDAVIAGSINRAAPLVMRVERVGGDTRYEAIVGLMRDAMASRPASARWADRWAAPFLWSVLLLAAGAAAVWSLFEPSRAPWVAVSVLIVTCPCALSLATPAALLAASGALARRGVLLRRLDALETLAQVDRLYVDKTGTLTRDRPRLVSTEVVRAGTPEDADALRRNAAALAALSRHPLSVALAAGVQPTPDEIAAWSEVREHPGAGLEGRAADGRIWRLGNATWVGGEDRADASADASGGPLLWFGRAGEPLMKFAFDETLRDDATAALQALRAADVSIGLLSGDTPERVERLAGTLPVDEVVGGADSERKLAAVKRAQQAGHVVAMIGDGINDAPVLAQADVSFAMGEGALLARAHADAVIVSNRLGAVVQARELAQRAMRVVRQNIAWAAGYNALCVPLALTGLLPPWLAGLGMGLSSLFVVGNAMRLRRVDAR